MGPQQTGYSWTNTSQWSQIPTVPADTNNQQASSAPTNYTGSTPSQNFTQPQNSYQSQANYGNTQTPPTPPETRRDMITRLYRRILGREPDNAGLNYYLFNTHIAEQQIARDMYESTEHQDFIKKALDVRDMIKKLEENEAHLKEIEARLINAETLAKNYKLLLEQKTQIINELRAHEGQQVNENTVVANTQTDIVEQQQQPMTAPHVQPQPNVQEIDDGILLTDPFAEDYNHKGKGCLGTIKQWFSF